MTRKLLAPTCKLANNSPTEASPAQNALRHPPSRSIYMSHAQVKLPSELMLNCDTIPFFKSVAFRRIPSHDSERLLHFSHAIDSFPALARLFLVSGFSLLPPGSRLLAPGFCFSTPPPFSSEIPRFPSTPR